MDNSASEDPMQRLQALFDALGGAASAAGEVHSQMLQLLEHREDCDRLMATLSECGLLSLIKTGLSPDEVRHIRSLCTTLLAARARRETAARIKQEIEDAITSLTVSYAIQRPERADADFEAIFFSGDMAALAAATEDVPDTPILQALQTVDYIDPDLLHEQRAFILQSNAKKAADLLSMPDLAWASSGGNTEVTRNKVAEARPLFFLSVIVAPLKQKVDVSSTVALPLKLPDNQPILLPP